MGFPVDKFSNAGIVLLRSKFFLYSQASPLRRSQVMPGQGWWMVHFGAALRGRRHRLLPLGASAERFPEMGEKMGQDRLEVRWEAVMFLFNLVIWNVWLFLILEIRDDRNQSALYFPFFPTTANHLLHAPSLRFGMISCWSGNHGHGWHGIVSDQRILKISPVPYLSHACHIEPYEGFYKWGQNDWFTMENLIS